MLSTSCVQQKDNQKSTLFGSQRLTQLCHTEIYNQKIIAREWRNSFREHSESFFKTNKVAYAVAGRGKKG